MWTYEQSTGRLLHDGYFIARGYSGWDDGDGIPEPGEGKNDPSMQGVVNIGPLPVGFYTIGPPRDSHGGYALPLTPKPGTNTLNRSSFLIHGDSRSHPGAASHGCIILSRTTREMIWHLGDRDLEVVAGPTKEIHNA